MILIGVCQALSFPLPVVTVPVNVLGSMPKASRISAGSLKPSTSKLGSTVSPSGHHDTISCTCDTVRLLSEEAPLSPARAQVFLSFIKVSPGQGPVFPCLSGVSVGFESLCFSLYVSLDSISTVETIVIVTSRN